MRENTGMGMRRCKTMSVSMIYCHEGTKYGYAGGLGPWREATQGGGEREIFQSKRLAKANKLL